MHAGKQLKPEARKQTQCMMGLKTLLFVALLAVLDVTTAVVAAGRRHHGILMPGSPYNISRNDRILQQVVLTATYSFNNQSNDAFLFKPSAILSAQRQVVKGVRYIVNFQISRTVCRKGDDNDLSNCVLQPEGPLNQVDTSESSSYSLQTGGFDSCYFDIPVSPGGLDDSLGEGDESGAPL